MGRPGETIYMTEPDEIIVYTQGWKGDRVAGEGEEPNVQVHGRVVINGKEIQSVAGVTVKAKGGDFVGVTVKFAPGSIKFISLPEEEFNLADLSELQRA